MSETWFTSDTHFHHLMCATKFRGFSSVEEHDENLIQNWNCAVSRADQVYHLGDFSLGKPEQALDVLSRLNGNIFLIRGNHDKTAKHAAVKTQFGWIKDLHEFKTSRFGVPIVLCHYCMRVWNRSHYGAYHLHGHSHGSLEADPSALALDVGVDPWGFELINFETIKKEMDKREWRPIDHHK